METSQDLSSLEFLRKFYLSTLCLGDYVTIGSNQPTNYPFWNEKTTINARKFVRFLEDLGSVNTKQVRVGQQVSRSFAE